MAPQRSMLFISLVLWLSFRPVLLAAVDDGDAARSTVGNPEAEIESPQKAADEDEVSRTLPEELEVQSPTIVQESESYEPVDVPESIADSVDDQTTQDVSNVTGDEEGANNGDPESESDPPENATLQDVTPVSDAVDEQTELLGNYSEPEETRSDHISDAGVFQDTVNGTAHDKDQSEMVNGTDDSVTSRLVEHDEDLAGIVVDAEESDGESSARDALENEFLLRLKTIELLTQTVFNLSKLPIFDPNDLDEESSQSEAKSRREAFLELIEFRPFLMSALNVSSNETPVEDSSDVIQRLRRELPAIADLTVEATNFVRSLIPDMDTLRSLTSNATVWFKRVEDRLTNFNTTEVLNSLRNANLTVAVNEIIDSFKNAERDAPQAKSDQKLVKRQSPQELETSPDASSRRPMGRSGSWLSIINPFRRRTTTTTTTTTTTPTPVTGVIHPPPPFSSTFNEIPSDQPSTSTGPPSKPIVSRPYGPASSYSKPVVDRPSTYLYAKSHGPAYYTVNSDAPSVSTDTPVSYEPPSVSSNYRPASYEFASIYQSTNTPPVYIGKPYRGLHRHSHLRH